MRVLVICQYYYPEPFRVNDICEELVKRGHEVTVITGEPNYPEGQIYHGYQKHQHADEMLNGVVIHRCPIIPRKKGSVYRLLNYYSYPVQAKKYAKKLMSSSGKPFDVVFVYQLSPVMMAKPAVMYKKKYCTPIVLYCLDLWPESLIAGGIAKTSFTYKVFHGISGRIYNAVDRILVTSRMFSKYIETEFGIDKQVIDYLPQYSDSFSEPLPIKKAGEQIHLLFAGNVGEIQSVDTIIKAAKMLKDKPVHFHILGGGTDLERIKEIAFGLKKVSFYGRRPAEEMHEFYSMADAMLVTLKKDPVLSLTLPGKVQSYMAAGKPIIGAIDGETARVIQEAKCGYCCRAEDSTGLVEVIKIFIEDEDKKKLCENSRRYYDSHFGKDNLMNKLEAVLYDQKNKDGY